MIAVLGAGATGLAAALELKDRGLPFVVLDPAPRAGGKLSEIRKDGFLCERAALGLLDREGVLGPLCARLGLSPVPASAKANGRWAVRLGRVHALPSGPGSFITSGVLTAREKLGLLREPFRRAPAPPGESVRDFFVRRLGPGGAFLGELIQTGIHAGDASLLEAESAFPEMVRAEREHGSLVRGMGRIAKARREQALREGRTWERARLTSFANGLGELTDALAREVSTGLKLGASVRALRPDGEAIELSLDDGSTLRASRVISALPAPALAALVSPLDAKASALLGEFRAAPIALVHLGVRRTDVARPLDGFGILGPGRAVLGTLFPASLWPGRAPDGCALLTSLVGGARFPEAAALDDAALLTVVREELSLTVGLRADAPASLTGIVRWPAAIPQATLGQAARVAALRAHLAAPEGPLRGRVSIAGSWFDGAAVLSCLKSGREAARATPAT